MPTLTRREREVLDCLGRAMAPRLIARVLGISVNTCRGYVKSLLSKLGVSSPLEAVVKAQELGLLRAATSRFDGVVLIGPGRVAWSACGPEA